MDKEFNPAMQFDAFTAGVEDGGLRSSSSIEILVCYILANCKEKITSQNIVDALVEGKIANYFEVSSAISKMIKLKNVVENDDGSLSLTGKSQFAIELVEKDLPIVIREKAVELVSKIKTLELYKKETKVDITEAQNGYKITLRITDNDIDYMALTLYVPTLEQADVIKNKFQEHPTEVYQNLINYIF
ncbi:MAG: DUF4364 family protein [Clostridiales bacterium]|nr:DUF4364 family protein [Clostridiales bacterium]